MAITISRRNFGRIATATVVAGSVRSNAFDTNVSKSESIASPQFPSGFLWGTSTASYQVEGAVGADGRGVSIWDTFSHTHGEIAGGDTGDKADDEYHRYGQDVLLLKELGVGSYRFSIAWPRIFHLGNGPLNPLGFEFYDRLIDKLLEARIVPFCTLYHWDLPQTLQDKGGWENPDTAKYFAEYAGLVSGRLSDRVKNFITMNEIRTFVELGYKDGTHAPGLRVDARRLAQLTHYVLLAHGMGVQAIRANAKAGTNIGIADNTLATTPVFDSPAHVDAASRAMREENAMYLTAIMEGRYTETYLTQLGVNAPRYSSEEMEVIASPLDFVGLNVYNPTYVRADENEKGYSLVKPSSSFPHMLSSWLTVGPECIYWVPKLVNQLWKVKTLYITENGASAADDLSASGQVLDIDRVMYLRNYLSQLQRVANEGIPVKGYFLWSLLDNFEWADGYEKRFGIYYVDFVSQKRFPKLSAHFYRNLILRNSVV